MNKSFAYALIGVSTAQGLAEALGVTRSAIVQWPDPLRRRQANEVLGCAVRHGRVRLVPADAARVAPLLASHASDMPASDMPASDMPASAA